MTRVNGISGGSILMDFFSLNTVTIFSKLMKCLCINDKGMGVSKSDNVVKKTGKQELNHL